MNTPTRRKRGRGEPTDAKPEKPGLVARQATQRLLSAIVDSGTSMDALTDDTHGHPHYLALDARDRSLVRAILMTALRYRGDLEALIGRYTDRPLPAGAASLRATLHVALAQILFLDVPDHSAADLAVASAQADPRNRRFAGLVNALCRRAGRERSRILTRIERNPARAPDWFAERLDQIYGAHLAGLIEAAHRRPAPIDLTLANESPENAANWAGRLDAALLPTGSLRLRSARDIPSLPGFAEGAFWVQDAAAAIPVRLFGDVKGKWIADLCAAPGGKTAQLAARGAQVTAVDKSSNRLKRLRANLERIGLLDNCTTIASDLLAFAPDDPFDAVLLDVPCSSTGTVRRHPDIPWTKTPEDIVKLAALQAGMLEHAAGLVAPGGLLVFSNCSLDPREGEENALAFLAANPNFVVEPVGAHEMPGLEGCLTSDGFVRTTPADLPLPDDVGAPGGLDGFFVARFRRTI